MAALLGAVGIYCHRNTVIKRMQRLEALTGMSIAVPRDRLVLELATLAHGLLPT